jgi:hypothetical protein
MTTAILTYVLLVLFILVEIISMIVDIDDVFMIFAVVVGTISVAYLGWIFFLGRGGTKAHQIDPSRSEYEPIEKIVSDLNRAMTSQPGTKFETSWNDGRVQKTTILTSPNSTKKDETRDDYLQQIDTGKEPDLEAHEFESDPPGSAETGRESWVSKESNGKKYRTKSSVTGAFDRKDEDERSATYETRAMESNKSPIDTGSVPDFRTLIEELRMAQRNEQDSGRVAMSFVWYTMLDSIGKSFDTNTKFSFRKLGVSPERCVNEFVKLYKKINITKGLSEPVYIEREDSLHEKDELEQVRTGINQNMIQIVHELTTLSIPDIKLKLTEDNERLSSIAAKLNRSWIRQSFFDPLVDVAGKFLKLDEDDSPGTSNIEMLIAISVMVNTFVRYTEENRIMQKTGTTGN